MERNKVQHSFLGEIGGAARSAAVSPVCWRWSSDDPSVFVFSWPLFSRTDTEFATRPYHTALHWEVEQVAENQLTLGDGSYARWHLHTPTICHVKYVHLRVSCKWYLDTCEASRRCVFWLWPRIHTRLGVAEAHAVSFHPSAHRQPASVEAGEWSTYQIHSADLRLPDLKPPNCSL